MHFSKVTYQNSRLSLREFEAARRRTAEINGCQVCIAWRSARDIPYLLRLAGAQSSESVATRATEVAPGDEFYQAVADWRTSPIFSPREKTAIEYAERLGTDPQGVARDEAFWARAKKLFSDDEIVDLSYCIACWMGLGRVTHALGLDGVCPMPMAETA
jgi:alkylhydroperoxidase family enzyme